VYATPVTLRLAQSLRRRQRRVLQSEKHFAL
jgi:hypothetical protein